MNSNSTEPVLRVSNLTKAYGDRTVLSDVSFSLAAGERVGLMGTSGSGKSTLLNCLGGIDKPDSGSIEITGNFIQEKTADELCKIRRETVSTIFQFFHLLPTLSARENIELPLELIGIHIDERNERVQNLLEEIQLTHRADATPDELSGGEMQRVAIARALAPRPKLILADEPTGNLDSKTGESILDLLEALSQKHDTAMLLVTHSKAATRICSRTLKIHDGALETSN
ncbi:MAG: ABC transporter ATP-binding protein [Verrucomicrobiales bacterium]|nr:ABC transporter ATP-binding protein [Verrucomicrobiales bacterium]MDC0314410.1 ABC transporter ATP-binding protein [bacterium]